jgi:hypothetical protein
MTRIFAATTVALLLLTGACSDSENYDQELIIQLFKPKGANLGAVKVTATQGATTRATTVANPFADCESNKLRIVPAAEEDGSYPDVTIRAEADNTTDVAETTVAVPQTNPIQLIIGTPTAAGIEPVGNCTPQVQPDAGVADTGTEPDAEPKREIGEPCSTPDSCIQGACINSFSTDTGAVYPFSGGYCTKDCESDKTCPTGASCELSTTPGGGDIGWYCLRTCSGADPCTRGGFSCQGEFCLPPAQ